MNEFLVALLWFIPAGVANMAPVLVAKWGWMKSLDRPMDGERKWRGKRLLGDHKTWRGLVSGVGAGFLTGVLGAVGLVWFLKSFMYTRWELSLEELMMYAMGFGLLGGLLGLGAIVGDAVESFFKRQWAQVPPGKSWFPWDQIDYIVGGIVFSLVIVRLPFQVYLLTLLIYFGLHVLVSYVGYLMGFKKEKI